MEVCRVIGSLTSTAKDRKLKGFKLLIVRPEIVGRGTPFVAVDTVGAGVGELVLVARGGAARLAGDCAGVPTDAGIVAILDPDQNDLPPGLPDPEE